MWKMLVSLVAMSLITSAAAAEGNWRVLFDGESLNGWRSIGGAHRFAVEDGVIVGTAIAGEPNGFLATEDLFGDFILEATFKVDGQLNSGLIFRGDSKRSYRNGRLFGYQAEIDPSPRQWAGGIHEEGRRGWLYPLSRNEACQAAYRTVGWNSYRVEAIGDSIRTFVNGAPCGRLIDDGLSEGFVALQVHSVDDQGRMGRPGDQIRWRDIRIMTDGLKAARAPMPDEVPEISYLSNQLTDWEQAHGYKLLWDGQTTRGWRGARLDGFPDRGWTIDNGELIVLAADGGESTNGGDIITLEEFSEFELEVDFKLTKGANSGIKYFVDPDLLQGEGSAIGLEFQILDDDNHPDAKLGVAGNRTVGSLYDLITAVNWAEPHRAKRVNRIGAWNRARIVVRGNTVEHWLNNVKVVEYQRGTQMYRALVAYSKYKDWPNFGEWEKGPILLQDHGDRVAFRSIKIRDLSAG